MPLSQTLRKNSRIIWTISIVQDQNPDAQTKSEFSEMTGDVLNTNTISHVTLCAADNLQRFRLMIKHGMNEEEAIKECQKMAEIWFMENTQSLEKLRQTKNLSILSWEEFLVWPEYSNTIIAIEKFYKENREFRNDFDGRMRQARDAIGNDAKISNPIEQTELLKKYLFEECAFQKFSASKGFDYELYKTPMNKAMRRIKNNTDFVPQGFMNEIYFTQFNLTNKKQNNNGHGVEKDSFSPIFNKSSTKYYAPPVEISIPVKMAEFIEKTFQMLPVKDQEKACQELIKFTSQNILPLCYISHENDMKI